MKFLNKNTFSSVILPIGIPISLLISTISLIVYTVNIREHNCYPSISNAVKYYPENRAYVKEMLADDKTTLHECKKIIKLNNRASNKQNISRLKSKL